MTSRLKLLGRVRDVRKRMRDAAMVTANEAAERLREAENRREAADDEKALLLDGMGERFSGEVVATNLELFDIERKHVEAALVEARQTEVERERASNAAGEEARRRAREFRVTERVLERAIIAFRSEEAKVEQKTNDDLASSQGIRSGHDSND